ncbi:hypothetical protein PIB30_081633 [Stylosanthes scabra]|uniref:Uncharacterized protein n=1 Tax=Stylosanthes scabra TaxID=79078 RepID=A0ABU6QT26_9FABA|nr:hypothetical protein [Stylosanthes scabra]
MHSLLATQPSVALCELRPSLTVDSIAIFIVPIHPFHMSSVSMLVGGSHNQRLKRPMAAVSGFPSIRSCSHIIVQLPEESRTWDGELMVVCSFLFVVVASVSARAEG